MKQNRPILIYRDLKKYGLDKNTVFKILLNRGVFKWLSVRRKLIKLKNIWKNDIRNTIDDIQQAKETGDTLKLFELRGRIKTLEYCRKQVRELCHSKRIQAPDNDKEAIKFIGGKND
jgi:predicted transcriptional regulator